MNAGAKASQRTRALDHLVMPTAALPVARERLSHLGFTVAPQGVHPFGTINACVYLSDGAFIEPLAIGDASSVEAAIAEKNSFVAADRRYRAAFGDEGLSGLVFATADAMADRDEFAQLEISGGPMVEFSRPSADISGKADMASFLLAFAAHETAPDLHFFTCERRRSPKIDRSALERHQNGAKRIAAVTAVSGDAKPFAGFLAAAARSKVREAAGEYLVALADTELHVVQDRRVSGSHLSAITFGVDALSVARALFDARGVGYEMRGESALYVPAAAGQGAAFIFEEMP